MAARELLESHGLTEKTIHNLVEETLKNGAQSVDNIVPFAEAGNTLLHFSVEFSLVSDVIKLLSVGARMDIKNRNGLTAKDIALENGNQALLQVLSRREEYQDHIKLVRSSRFHALIGNNRDRFAPTIFSVSGDKMLGLRFGKVYDNYMDWSDFKRSQRLRELALELSKEELQLNTHIKSLSSRKQQSLLELQRLHRKLRNIEHNYCLQIWRKVEMERMVRTELANISSNIASLKLNKAKINNSVRWQGHCQYRKYSGMVVKLWRGVLLKMTGEELRLEDPRGLSTCNDADSARLKYTLSPSMSPFSDEDEEDSSNNQQAQYGASSGTANSPAIRPTIVIKLKDVESIISEKLCNRKRNRGVFRRKVKQSLYGSDSVGFDFTAYPLQQLRIKLRQPETNLTKPSGQKKNIDDSQDKSSVSRKSVHSPSESWHTSKFIVNNNEVDGHNDEKEVKSVPINNPSKPKIRDYILRIPDITVTGNDEECDHEDANSIDSFFSVLRSIISNNTIAQIRHIELGLPNGNIVHCDGAFDDKQLKLSTKIDAIAAVDFPSITESKGAENNLDSVKKASQPSTPLSNSDDDDVNEANDRFSCNVNLTNNDNLLVHHAAVNNKSIVSIQKSNSISKNRLLNSENTLDTNSICIKNSSNSNSNIMEAVQLATSPSNNMTSSTSTYLSTYNSINNSSTSLSTVAFGDSLSLKCSSKNVLNSCVDGKTSYSYDNDEDTSRKSFPIVKEKSKHLSSELERRSNKSSMEHRQNNDNLSDNRKIMHVEPTTASSSSYDALRSDNINVTIESDSEMSNCCEEKGLDKSIIDTIMCSSSVNDTTVSFSRRLLNEFDDENEVHEDKSKTAVNKAAQQYTVDPIKVIGSPEWTRKYAKTSLFVNNDKEDKYQSVSPPQTLSPSKYMGRKSGSFHTPSVLLNHSVGSGPSLATNSGNSLKSSSLSNNVRVQFHQEFPGKRRASTSSATGRSVVLENKPELDTPIASARSSSDRKGGLSYSPSYSPAFFVVTPRGIGKLTQQMNNARTERYRILTSLEEIVKGRELLLERFRFVVSLRQFVDDPPIAPTRLVQHQMKSGKEKVGESAGFVPPHGELGTSIEEALKLCEVYQEHIDNVSNSYNVSLGSNNATTSQLSVFGSSNPMSRHSFSSCALGSTVDSNGNRSSSSFSDQKWSNRVSNKQSQSSSKSLSFSDSTSSPTKYSTAQFRYHSPSKAVPMPPASPTIGKNGNTSSESENEFGSPSRIRSSTTIDPAEYSRKVNEATVFIQAMLDLSGHASFSQHDAVSRMAVNEREAAYYPSTPVAHNRQILSSVANNTINTNVTGLPSAFRTFSPESEALVRPSPWRIPNSPHHGKILDNSYLSKSAVRANFAVSSPKSLSASPASRRGVPLGAPPQELLGEYELVMQHLEEIWTCELASFVTVQRLAQTLAQREQTWRRIETLIVNNRPADNSIGDSVNVPSTNGFSRENSICSISTVSSSNNLNANSTNNTIRQTHTSTVNTTTTTTGTAKPVVHVSSSNTIDSGIDDALFEIPI